MVGFNIVSWYGAVAAAAVIYLLWAAVLDTGHRHYRAVKRFVRPESPEPPAVVLGHPGFHISTVRVPERTLSKKAYLTKLDPFYVIENKEAGVTASDVTTGVRRKDDGREHAFEEFRAPALAPGEAAPVRNVSIPPEVFNGLDDREYQTAFHFWARFGATGRRWEVVYDPEAREHSWTPL